MKNSYICFILITWTLTVSQVQAQFDYGFDFSKAGSAGLQFLKIGVGARECAMGETASAIATDANAIFWNIGGIALSQKRQVYFSNSQWLVNSQHYAGSVVVPFGSYTVGLSLVSLAIQDYEETTVREPDGTGNMIGAYDIAAGIAVARRFTDKLSIGIQVKYVQEKLDTYSASDILFDVGALYFTGFRRLRLGFSLQHFGPDIKIADQSFRTPLLFRISAAEEVLNFERFQLSMACELVHPTDNKEWVNCGTELTLMKLLQLRAGYRFNQDEGSWTAGAGFRLDNLTFTNVRIDYAYMPFGEIFGDVHRISMGFTF